MDEKIKAFLDQRGVDRPVLSMRQVGERIEIHLLGDDLPIIYQEKPDTASEAKRDPALMPAKPFTSAELSRMLVKELKQICESMGIPTAGRKKITLITNILERQNEHFT